MGPLGRRRNDAPRSVLAPRRNPKPPTPMSLLKAPRSPECAEPPTALPSLSGADWEIGEFLN